MDLEISISGRFRKSYSRASPSLQLLAEGAVHDLMHQIRADPATVLLHYDRLAHLNIPIIEVPISGSHRLLARYSRDSLILLDMGPHSVVPRYSESKYTTDTHNLQIAPANFWPDYRSRLFIDYPDRELSLAYAEEISQDWLFFLGTLQNDIFQDIALGIINGPPSVHFVVGGPGTGKTCILLSLLKLLADSEISVGIELTDDLASYLEAATGLNIAAYRHSIFSQDKIDVLLVDDPTQLLGVEYLMNKATCVVAAFDPLQLSTSLTDREFSMLEEHPSTRIYWLEDCYRQKRNVGLAAKQVMDVVAASTPFLAEEKIEGFRKNHELLTRQANGLRFVNPHGYVRSYPGATISDINLEVIRLLYSEHLMWKHSPSVLLLLVDCTLATQTEALLGSLLRKPYTRLLNFKQVQKIKGLEFQHVLILMPKELFAELNDGFSGSGRKTYDYRRLLRIPFSRAKDSLVIFGLETV